MLWICPEAYIGTMPDAHSVRIREGSSGIGKNIETVRQRLNIQAVLDHIISVGFLQEPPACTDGRRANTNV
jgi:hypothetical protein